MEQFINLPNMLCPRSEWHIIMCPAFISDGRSCSASEMFVNNNIYNFEGRLRTILMILLCELAAAVMF